jgi:hypothetical protein
MNAEPNWHRVHNTQTAASRSLHSLHTGPEGRVCDAQRIRSFNSSQEHQPLPSDKSLGYFRMSLRDAARLG